MKVIIIAILAGAILVWLALASRDGMMVNCSLAEWHPDLVKYRDVCRGTR